MFALHKNQPISKLTHVGIDPEILVKPGIAM